MRVHRHLLLDIICGELMRVAFTCRYAEISDNEMQMEACGNKMKADVDNIFNSAVEFYFHVVICFILCAWFLMIMISW